mgnify:CR=1 FL=1
MTKEELLEKLGIDVKARINDTNFTWHEALYLKQLKEYAKPEKTHLDNIRRQAMALQDVRGFLGTPLFITSWLRSPAYNKLISGAPNSVHLTGLATDFVPGKMDIEEAKKRIQDSGIYPGRGEHNSTNWIHLDLSGPTWFMV